MKKLIALFMVAALGCTLGACSAPQETEETDDGSTETTAPVDNEVAKSMTYPETIGDMEFMVAGTWEKIEGVNQLTFNTGFCTILVGVADDDDEAALVERMLAGAFASTGDLLYRGDREEVSLKDISGSKESITVDGTEGEVFVWKAGSRTYALVALYPDKSQQAVSFEAVDTLFSSMSYTKDDGQPVSDGEQPSAEQPSDIPAGDQLPSEGDQASQEEG